MAVVIVALAFPLGCTEQRSHPSMLVQGHPPRPWIYDAPYSKGSIEWYGSAELDRIVREYARDRRVAFQFSGTQGSFSVSRERDCMVHGSYGSGIGSPMLLVRIGWDGYVIEHRIVTAICGIGLEDPATQPVAE